MRCGGKAGNETGLLAVDKGVGPAAPGPAFALDEQAEIDQLCYMFQAVDCVLEPPLSYNLFLVYGADGIVTARQGLSDRPAQGFRLCVMHVIS